MLWIAKWVDYSDKYGFGYQLSDDSIGVSFNDLTKMILLADGNTLHYIDKQSNEHYHSKSVYPLELAKKVKLLNYFQQYMTENLLKVIIQDKVLVVCDQVCSDQFDRECSWNANID